MEKKLMDGGQFSFGRIKRKLLGKESMGDVVRKTKSSETSLINSYEEYDDKTKKYNKAYDTHLKNLKDLDNYVNFKGLETLFKKIIMKDNFKTGHIDRSNPLLFKNYLIETDVPPSTLRKEHILQQVRYILKKYFPNREHLFIKNIDVEVGKTAFLLNIVTIDNIKKSRKINHNEYIISKSETKKALNDVISTAKKNLKRESLVIEYNNSNSRNKSSDISSFKSKDRSDYKSKKLFKSKDSKASNASKNSKGSKGSKGSKSKGTKKSFNKLLEGMIKLDLDSDKSKSAKKKRSHFNLNKENNKKSKHEKLSMYWTTEQRKAAEKAKRNAEAAKQIPISTIPFAPQLPAFGNQPIQAQAEGILGTIPSITQPLSNDPEEQKCNQFTGNFEACKANNCWLDKETKTCGKRPAQKAQYGAPYSTNPFGQPPANPTPFGQPPANPTPFGQPPANPTPFGPPPNQFT
jgi:hypothetical protein